MSNKEKPEKPEKQRSRYEDNEGRCVICNYPYIYWHRCYNPACHDGR